MACHPYDYQCRAQAGEFGTVPQTVLSAVTGTSAGTTTNAPATFWWLLAVGVALLAALVQVEPKLGGWLLLLIVLGLALSPQGKAIITGK